ncbi:MAG: amidohydrolase [Flavobacteriales bacterium CG_4_9_14_3_um_filter_40_17]|nr:MAG: amidohydrolase [Flavobacteriales bacterium CG_4_9_14_3_um_filter_40_17]
MKKPIVVCLLMISALSFGQKLDKKISDLSKTVESKVIEWRRDIHQNPELSNREFKTGEKIVKHLESLGIEVHTGVAKTGVVGVLKGGKPGKVVALRADMDALPVTERVDLPFKSEVTAVFNGQTTGVMHACGHDTHVAMLMGVAEVLSKIKSDLSGTVVFIFQPAEEGAPGDEEGGAELIVKEGVLKTYKVDAIFGLHISSGTHVGKINYKPGGALAASQKYTIDVKGKQSHGSTPWKGIDPIVASAEIINGLQTIISRESELTNEAAVITVGAIHSGIRNNIIPESAQMIGTIRTLDYDMQKKINRRMKEMVPAIAAAFGAVANIDIAKGTPITYNDPDLTAKMLPSLQKVAGTDNVKLVKAITGAEDFSFYQEQIPGFFFFLGGTPLNVKESEAPSHHTPDFYIDESAMLLGVKAMSQVAVDFLNLK